MLTQKLLRIEDSAIQEIEELAQKLSEKEYTSFSALVRKLIRIGLDNMETEILFIEKIKTVSCGVNLDKNKVLLAVKKDIERMAEEGCNYAVFYPDSFRSLVAKALEGNEWADKSKVSFDTYHEMLYYVMVSLYKEGFKISASFSVGEGSMPGLYYHINW